MMFQQVRCSTSLLAFMLFLVIGTSNLGAQVGQSPTDKISGSPNNVVVLRTGETIRGTVNRSEDRIRIKTRNGFRTFSPDEVRVTGKNLKDAYQQLSATIPTDDLKQRMELVYWCRSHSLITEMVKELKLILILNNKHREASELLKEYLPQVEGESGKMIVGQIARNNQTIILRGSEEETLGGLPPEIAADFTKRIQPLLRNKCGSTNCHGARTQSSFQLKSISTLKSKHRQHSRENLLSALKLMNIKQPEQSALWTKATTAHAGKRLPALNKGKAASLQKQNLSAWIVAVTSYLKESPESGLAQSLSEVQSLRSPPQAGEEMTQVKAESQTPPEKLNGVLLDEEVISSALKKTLPDVFDPAEFNRRR